MDEEDVVEIATEEDTFSTPQERNVWNGRAVHSLIKEYSKLRVLFGNPEIRRKKIWIRIASRLQALGFNFDSDQCEKKWRNLKNYYSFNKGKGMVTWPFYKAMRDALCGEQNIPKTKVIVSEENGQHILPANVKTEIPEISNFEQEVNEEDDSAPPPWFEKFITQFREDEKDKLKMLEKMHEDIIKLENKKCVLLQALIEKLA